MSYLQLFYTLLGERTYNNKKYDNKFVFTVEEVNTSKLTSSTVNTISLSYFFGILFGTCKKCEYVHIK